MRYGATNRDGRLELGDGTGHRQAALEARAFLIDWLKTKAPIRKLEETAAGAK